MRKTTTKGLLAHKLRLALTGLAIILGVTFITGTFVLTDTLHNTFSALIGNIYQNVDFQVRGVAQFSGTSAVRNPIPESLLATVRRVPGVAAAEGGVEGYAQFVAPDGKPISTGSESTLGISYDPDQQISDLHIVQGSAPRTGNDVVMDAGTAQQYGFHVGQRVRILLYAQPRTFTITGIAQFGSVNNLAGVTLAAFTLPTAQQVMQEVGQFDYIDVVTTPGVSKQAVGKDIARVLPRGVQVVTGQTVAAEQDNSVTQSLSFLSTALLIFAFISLFVGAFTIFNTFSIIVGQRTKELALLRIVGASRGQIFRSVLGEAAAVGIVSSAIGIGLGVLAAVGLEQVLRLGGITLPPGSLVFAPRTVAVALAVGVGVTVISAIGPARRAIRIPPVAALGDHAISSGAPLRGRLGWGSAVTLAGVLLLAAGLAKSTIAAVGVGAACIFVGVAMLTPAVARPSSSLLGRPFARTFGVAGRLGRENSMRSPRRTAQTAAALMVGLALVSAIAVFGASASQSVTSNVDRAVSADLIVSSTTSSGGLSTLVPAAVAAARGVTGTNTIYRGQCEINGSVSALTGTSTRHLAATVTLQLTSGSSASLADGDLLVDSTTAAANHWKLGDAVPVRFAQTGRSVIRIGGIYQPNSVVGSYVVSDKYFLAHFGSSWNPGALLVDTNGTAAAENAVTRALAAYPSAQVQTKSQYLQASMTTIKEILGLVYALLGLAVIIALIGIVNTLMLSVFERTREIGLLRAVGMRQRQVRSMIRCEAVILAVFGAVIGIVVGTGMGIALVSSLKHEGITQIAVPWSSLVAFLAVSMLLGLVAATWPARRAARMDVLAAIAAV
jgi:putative ABC transport system permease protein